MAGQVERVAVHFRIRGNNVQLIRTVTDPTTNKARLANVGFASLISGELNARARENLSPDELAVVSTWIERRREIKDKELALTALTLPETIDEVIGWVQRAEKGEVEAIAEHLASAMRDLRRTIDQKLKRQVAK